METDDFARDCKTDAGAISLGGEEWREDIFGNLLRDCRAVVRNINIYTFLTPMRGLII